MKLAIINDVGFKRPYGFFCYWRSSEFVLERNHIEPNSDGVIVEVEIDNGNLILEPENFIPTNALKNS
jgi:hypothetical protein